MKKIIEQLNKEILEAVRKFEDETGCVLYSISTKQVDAGSVKGPEKITVSVSCSVEVS